MPTILWAGTDAAFDDYEAARAGMAALRAAGPAALEAQVLAYGGRRVEGGGFDFGPPYQREGRVAVIEVKGMLVNGAAGILGRIFGMVGYDDVKSAISAALADEEVGVIMMLYRSPGGEAVGTPDMSDFIQAADKVKPIMSYAADTMASAAYWMGASSRHVSANQLATVGSVGAAMVFTDITEAMKQQGVSKKVYRSGPYKALGAAYEPMSDILDAQMKEQVSFAAGIFTSFVAGRRGVDVAKFDAMAGQGRTFFGAQAMDVKLIDAVFTPAQALEHAKSLDKGTSPPQNSRNPKKELSMTLAPKTLLALAAGTAVSALGLDKPEAHVENAVPDATGLQAATTEATALAEAIAASKSSAVTEAIKPIQASLDAANGKVVNLEGEVNTLKSATQGLNTQINDQKALLEKADAVLRTSASNMSVALGGKADIAASLSGAALQTEHDRLAAEYKAKFPGGTIAAVTPTAKTEPETTATAFNPLTALAKSAPKA